MLTKSHFGLIAAFGLIATAIATIATLNFSLGATARPCRFARVTISRIGPPRALCFGYPGPGTNSHGLAGSLH